MKIIPITTANICQKPFNKRTPVALSYNHTDTVTFSGTAKRNTQKVKKSDFKGVDAAIIEKYRVDISGFKSINDLQDWATQKIKDDFIFKDFKGRRSTARAHRLRILKNWQNYIVGYNSPYKPSLQLIILDAITKDLKPDNDALPPVLNKNILAEVINNLTNHLNQNPQDLFNLNKLYQNKLNRQYLEISNISYTGWVTIPSQKNDPKNFEYNIEKLQALSHPRWCTKTHNAAPYLAIGDFHLYYEKGYPKLALRFIGKNLYEIQGTQNNDEIPIEYIDIIEKYIKESNFKLSATANFEIIDAINARKRLQNARKDLKEAIEQNDYKTILNYFNFETTEDETGLLSVFRYDQPENKYYTFADLGIDENKMFEKIKSIESTAIFNNSQLTDTGQLKYIGGSADFENSELKTLGNIEHIGGSANFSCSRLTSLGKLKFIGGSADFSNSKINDIEKLETIKGKIYHNSPLIEKMLKDKNFI